MQRAIAPLARPFHRRRRYYGDTAELEIGGITMTSSYNTTANTTRGIARVATGPIPVHPQANLFVVAAWILVASSLVAMALGAINGHWIVSLAGLAVFGGTIRGFMAIDKMLQNRTNGTAYRL
jgi:hypothetical protein